MEGLGRIGLPLDELDEPPLVVRAVVGKPDRRLLRDVGDRSREAVTQQEAIEQYKLLARRALLQQRACVGPERDAREPIGIVEALAVLHQTVQLIDDAADKGLAERCTGSRMP